ncbi:MAG: transport protein TonB [Firmicutes bacterium]|nr:transport protein TonB [Bacillota bacterium]
MLHLQPRWRKAITTSLLLHVLLVAGSGYLVTRLIAAPPVLEQYIELDLSSAPEPQAFQDNQVAAATSPHLPASQSAPTPTPATVPEQSSTTPVVASTGALSMVAAEVPATGGSNETGTTVPAGPSAGGTASASNGSGSPRGVIAPGILSKTEPSYPSVARQAAQQGTVVLKVQILENGRPGEVSVVRSSGYPLLDDAAVDAVEQWRFIPAKDRSSGRAITCYSTLPVSFRLH